MAIDLDIVEAEIDRLEAKQTTYYVCDRLATLYNIRDHMMPSRSGKSATMPELHGSEFLEMCSNRSYGEVMDVIDGHMSALAVVNPREYQSVMERLRAIRPSV